MGKIEDMVKRVNTGKNLRVGINDRIPNWTPEEQREIYVGMQYLLAELAQITIDAAHLSNVLVVDQRKLYKAMNSEPNPILEKAIEEYAASTGLTALSHEEYTKEQFENANDMVMRVARLVKNETKSLEDLSRELWQAMAEK